MNILGMEDLVLMSLLEMHFVKGKTGMETSFCSLMTMVYSGRKECTRDLLEFQQWEIQVDRA